MKRGKKYLAAEKSFEKLQQYSAEEALKIVRSMAYAKFDETIELSIRLNIKKGTSIRDTFVLPHQFKGEKKILVFAKGDKEQEAKDAGAVYVGNDDLIAKIREGWLDFDVAVATPDMMKDVGKLGQILGRRGLMPNPKTQTVTNDVRLAIQELQKGRIEFRSDKTGVVHLPIAKLSMANELIIENINSSIVEVARKRPPETKGEFIKNVVVSSSMGPGVKLSQKEER